MLVLLIVLVVIAVPFLLALNKPNSFLIQRSIEIEKPSAEIFAYIKFLKNQDNFSVWMMLDPAMQKSVEGEDGTIGFESHWVSKHKKVGEGKQRITGIADGKRIDFSIHFIKPWENKADAFMELEVVDARRTKVSWGFGSPLTYMNKVTHVVLNMDKMLGKDLERGLSNLKRIMEK